MMLVKKASWGVVHSGLTERERCGASWEEKMTFVSVNKRQSG